jgi:hypothetical protein
LGDISCYPHYLLIICLGEIPIKLAYCKETFLTEDIPYLIDGFVQPGQGRRSDNWGSDDYTLSFRSLGKSIAAITICPVAIPSSTIIAVR